MIGDAPDRRLAHDLNHLLTAILAAVDSTLARDGVDAATREDMHLARLAAERAAALLGASGGQPRPAALSVNDALRDAAPLLARLLGDGIRLELIPAERDPCVLAEPVRLGRLLTNLAMNARAAMPEGGMLVLRGGRAGSYGTIAMEDSGSGIPPEVLPRIFEPGFTTRQAAGGSGLGLAIVHDIVRQFGGFVTAGSRPGLGTTISVHLPLAPTPMGREDSPPCPVPIGPALQEGGETPTTRTVLLVEDETILRHLAERALRQAGWRVVAADSAAMALAAVGAVKPAVVVSDVVMPDMDGPALVAALRAIWPKLPAILVSGYAESAVRVDPGHDNVVFLAKPYTLAALVTAVLGAVRD